jgi:hypothetical protein
VIPTCFHKGVSDLGRLSLCHRIVKYLAHRPVCSFGEGGPEKPGEAGDCRRGLLGFVGLRVRSAGRSFLGCPGVLYTKHFEKITTLVDLVSEADCETDACNPSSIFCQASLFMRSRLWLSKAVVWKDSTC